MGSALSDMTNALFTLVKFVGDNVSDIAFLTCLCKVLFLFASPKMTKVSKIFMVRLYGYFRGKLRHFKEGLSYN